MRLRSKEKLADHNQIQGQQPEDHHPPAEFYRIIINSQSVPATGAVELRQSLIYDGHKTIRAVLRGHENTDIQGHTGAFVQGSDLENDSIGASCRPYGGAGYTISYMGSYSRIHGDSYLTNAMFGNNIRLRDIWIDDDEAVLEFYNAAGTAQNLTVYGTVMVK